MEPAKGFKICQDSWFGLAEGSVIPHRARPSLPPLDILLRTPRDQAQEYTKIEI